MTVPDCGNPVRMAVEARWEPLREQLDGAMECAAELMRTARQVIEESQNLLAVSQDLLDESCRLRSRRALAVEDRRSCRRQ
jgi:hypothetical protein